MKILLDPAEEADLPVARVVQACLPGSVVGQPGTPASKRARAAGQADLTVVVCHRRANPTVATDRGRASALRFGRLVADCLGLELRGWASHEVFGRRPRSAHQRPVVWVQPMAGTPVWQSAAGILTALRRFLA